MKKLKHKYIAEDETHPGEILKDELIARGLKAVDLISLTGLSKGFVSQLINGSRSINATTAVKLELALGIPAKHWLTMQCDFDIANARKELQTIKPLKKKVSA